jgi:hypothetical protein
MKKYIILYSICIRLIIAGTSLTAQVYKGAPALQKNFKVERPARPVKEQVGIKPVNILTENKATWDDPTLMTSLYDKQTNASTQNRMYYYPDGTMAAVSTISHLDDFSDRGTGYNYFDGTSWGPEPTERLESEQTGWPSYSPLGSNGEIIVSHTSSSGLKILTRLEKGTGAWTEATLPGPAEAVDISWPRVVTSGPDHNIVHIICLTYVPYQGLESALLYYRSQDGGQSWDINGEILPGMTSADYLGFSADTYSWATPVGNTIAFTVGDSWYDQFLMKSTDNGTTWTKTKIWSSLYNKWVSTGPNDTTPVFYCPDGTNAIVLDKDGKAHVTFGLLRAKGDKAGKYWYPFTDGIVYWCEYNGLLPQSLEPDTLIAHGNLIGWVTDTAVFYAQPDELAYYYGSLSSQPTLSYDSLFFYDSPGVLYAMWSGVSTLRDQNNFLLRHIYGRGGLHYSSSASPFSWYDKICEVSDNFLYLWSECVYPTSIPVVISENVYVAMQRDDDAGIYLNGIQGAQGQASVTNNDLIVLSPYYCDFFFCEGIQQIDPDKIHCTAFPNPTKGICTINISTNTTGDLSLTVTSMTGQEVYEISKGPQSPGSYQFTIDATNLNPGLYFYTVRVGNYSVTKKMIVAG